MKRLLSPLGYAVTGLEKWYFFYPLAGTTIVWVVAFLWFVALHGFGAVSPATWKEAFLLKAVWLFAGVRGQRIRREGCPLE